MKQTCIAGIGYEWGFNLSICTIISRISVADANELFLVQSAREGNQKKKEENDIDSTSKKKSLCLVMLLYVCNVCKFRSLREFFIYIKPLHVFRLV